MQLPYNLNKQTKTEVMSNMSYCRFENTSRDLQDCIDAINEGDLTEMSRYEKVAFVDLISQATELAEQFEDYSEDDLEEFLEGLQDKD